jgi:hypothetical protein
MKTMTCKQLGGACDQTFSANTFEEMAALSKKHGMEMFQKGDAAHLQALQAMQKSMQSPTDMANWMNEKKKLFQSLPETK